MRATFIQSSVSTAAACWYAEVSRRPLIVKFCVLASGSSGNCALLATDRTRILVDVGLSFKALVRRRDPGGERVEPRIAVLAVPGHTDRVSGPARLARRLGI